MYVIDVIPLSRTAPGVLSYRSRTEQPIGSIVDIILRKTAAQGIVVVCIPASEAKEMLKHARFLLSKSTPSASGILPSSVLVAAEEVANYHATTIGAVLVSLFGEYIRSSVAIPATVLKKGNAFSRTCVEASVDDRVRAYTSMLESASKDNSTVLLVVPTIAECVFWKEAFSTFKPLVLSGTLTAARRVKALEEASSHQGLIIATPSFSWTPITHLSHIIVDRISAGTYTLPKRPYIEMCRALESLAKARTLPITYGDFPLPLEYRDDKSLSTKNNGLVELHDARRDPDDQTAPDGPWRALPKPVMDRIEQELSTGGRAVVLAARTGYAPAVVCGDCGQALTDERKMALSFTTAHGKRMFRSTDGKTLIDAKMKCPRCESWNLVPLGVGQERVVEELRVRFPESTIIEANSEALRSAASAKKLLLQVNEPGTITVGGEALLPWLLLTDSTSHTTSAPLGVIASADSLLSLPFWRSRERFVRLAYFFGSLCKEMILITRHPEDAAVDAVIHPTTTSFWQEERMLREALQYPPYGTLITLAIEGSEQAVSRLRDHIIEEFSEFNPSTLSQQILTTTTVRSVFVISLAKDIWPDTTLSSLLKALPPNVRVRIDPESLW